MRIAITPGEPAGIGPDLCLQLAAQARDIELVAICDPALLEARAGILRVPFSCRILQDSRDRVTSSSSGFGSIKPTRGMLTV